MTEKLITPKEIESGIATEYLPFFQIGSVSFAPIVKPVIEAFWEAVRIFAPKVKLVKPIHVLLGTSPFSVEKEEFVMHFASKGDVLHFVVESFIFIDVAKVIKYPKELQIASFLEEFVHAFMNVKDEDLTKFIVEDIYAGIRVVNGAYVATK